MAGTRDVLGHARYRVLHSLLALLTPIVLFANGAVARAGEREKDQLKFGFIKLTDMAPLAIAKEKFYFEDEGLQMLLDDSSAFALGSLQNP